MPTFSTVHSVGDMTFYAFIHAYCLMLPALGAHHNTLENLPVVYLTYAVSCYRLTNLFDFGPERLLLGLNIRFSPLLPAPSGRYLGSLTRAATLQEIRRR
jgi:hypothetical protein